MSGLRVGDGISKVESTVLTIPTDRPESDGTLTWSSTTMVIAWVFGRGEMGMGWTFAHGAASSLITGPLSEAIVGLDPMCTSAAYAAMRHAMRNIGRPGLGREALSAVDIAVWDLKAKLLGVSVATLLGPARDEIPIYGSGGFTSYDDATLENQLGDWAASGIKAVKMKVGRNPPDDRRRVMVARRAIGDGCELFVDANGAWSRKQALAECEAYVQSGVTWVEEPVPADDIRGLRLMRDRGPAGVDIAVGEYGYELSDFKRLLEADCLDVLQADVTRAGGITGMLAVSALCEAYGIPLSTHCAPHVHAHLGCALRPMRHLEYFHDHSRIEHLVLEGALSPMNGALSPNWSQKGLGISLRDDAERFVPSSV